MITMGIGTTRDDVFFGCIEQTKQEMLKYIVDWLLKLDQLADFDLTSFFVCVALREC